MGVYLRGRTYWFKREIAGKAYARSLKIRKGQELLLSEAVRLMELQITADHLGIPFKRPALMPFSRFADAYIEQEKGQTGPAEWDKKRCRLDVVKGVWGTIPVHKIGREDVTRLERFLLDSRKVAESTVNRYFEVLRRLFRRAIEEGQLRDNPIRFFQPFREDGGRRALSRDELERVLAAASQVQLTPRGVLTGSFTI